MWHSWLFLTNWETLIMTFRVSDWHSGRDLDSLRNSCIHNHLFFFINHENLKRAFVWSQRCFAFLIFYCWIGFWFWKVFLCFLWLFSPYCKNPLVAPGLCSSEKRWFLEQYLSQLCPQWVFLWKFFGWSNSKKTTFGSFRCFHFPQQINLCGRVLLSEVFGLRNDGWTE